MKQTKYIRRRVEDKYYLIPESMYTSGLEVCLNKLTNKSESTISLTEDEVALIKTFLKSERVIRL